MENQVFPVHQARRTQYICDVAEAWLTGAWIGIHVRPVSGRGTREEEKGVAPVEKGTFGLFVPLVIVTL